MGKSNLSQLQKRLISGFILGPLVVLVIIYGGWPFALMVAGFAVIALYEWVQLSLKVKSKILYLVLGIPYVLFSFWFLYSIRVFLPLSAGLLFIAMIWSSDVGAYLTGKRIGGPKLAPKISPNKTWSGFAGALLFPAFIGIVLAPVLDTGVELGKVFAAAMVVGIVGQCGDLIVSFIKRKAEVKDSGDLIPGHGGLLDRVDSMMLAAPAFYYLWLGALTYGA